MSEFNLSDAVTIGYASSAVGAFRGGQGGNGGGGGTTTVDAGGAAPAQPTRPNLLQVRAAVLAAVGKISGKEGNRDDLSAGSAHKMRVQIIASVEGCEKKYNETFDAEVNVGHDSIRNSSVTPDQNRLVAWLLGKMNDRTRRAIVASAAEEFAANNNELPATEEGINEAKAMLEKLRSQVQQDVRGSVSVKHARATEAVLKVALATTSNEATTVAEKPAAKRTRKQKAG